MSELSDDISTLYARARDRWSEVEWPMGAYENHVNGERPRHAIDLYLAGAAGWRLDAAWDAVHGELGPQVRRVLMRLPTADMTVDDLWSETILRLVADASEQPQLPCGRHPAKIIRYRGRVKLTNYLIVIGRNAAIAADRRRTVPTVALAVDPPTGARAPGASATPEQITADREATDAFTQALPGVLEGLSAEQRAMLAMVYRDGMQQKDAGALLGWSSFKASREMAKAVKQMARGIRRAGVEWTPGLAAGWSGIWDQSWKRMQEPPRGAS